MDDNKKNLSYDNDIMNAFSQMQAAFDKMNSSPAQLKPVLMNRQKEEASEAVKTSEESNVKQEAASEVKSEIKAEPKPVEVKSEIKSEPKPVEVKSEIKAEVKPEPVIEARHFEQPQRAEPKPVEVKPEIKPEPKPVEVKPEIKPETKPVEIKPEPKPVEVKPEIKPEPKPVEIKPEIKAEVKPEPKHAEPVSEHRNETVVASRSQRHEKKSAVSPLAGLFKSRQSDVKQEKAQKKEENKKPETAKQPEEKKTAAQSTSASQRQGKLFPSRLEQMLASSEVKKEHAEQPHANADKPSSQQTARPMSRSAAMLQKSPAPEKPLPPIHEINPSEYKYKPEQDVDVTDFDTLLKSITVEEHNSASSPVAAAAGAGLGASSSIKAEKHARVQTKTGGISQKKASSPAKSGTRGTSGSSSSGASKNKNKKKKKKKKKSTLRTLIKILIILILVIGLAVAGYVGYWAYNIIKTAPEINPSNIYEFLSENSAIVDSNGEIVQNIYSGDSLRTNVEYKDIPKDMINAFVSIEDKTFWTHHGFNFVRIAGAVWNYVTGQSPKISGTSTITQQLARNIYLAETKSERSMVRKIREAYYTILIEKVLTKEQIIEAYLNTIYLGYNSSGVQAAAQAYFSKDVKDLDLLECATLASLPQSPNSYAPIKRQYSSLISDDTDIDIISRDNTWTVYYNDKGTDRMHLVLRFMHDQGKIDDATYEANKTLSIRDHINPGTNVLTASETSYFADYVKSQVLSDLQTQLGYTLAEARNLLYSGGLIINSTIDLRIQSIIEDVWSTQDNFPGIVIENKDREGNILYPKESDTVEVVNEYGVKTTVAVPDRVLLYLYSKYFNEDGSFTIKKTDGKFLNDGSLLLYKGQRLNIYRVTNNGEADNQIEFKNLYLVEDKKFYTIAGGYINIPAKYKTRDESDNVIISADFFRENQDAVTKNADGTLTLNPAYYTVKEKIIQPQAAMVMLDQSNGQIVGMIGGRDISGQLLYNRATAVRQPGSCIKPLSVYSTALQVGYEESQTGKVTKFNAALPLDDAPIANEDELWPVNSYSGYRGMKYLRYAVQQSINPCAVRLFMQLDPYRCIENLQNLGVTSIVTTAGTANDLNAASLALGGLTKGITPLQMAGAYAAIANEGVYNEPVCYTTVTNKRGDIILQKEPVSHKVLDKPVAQLTLDILRTTVTNGLSYQAAIKGYDTAGKTGTTSSRYDLWFCGMNPKYTASVWMGNDYNIRLNSGSGIAAELWKKVMEKVVLLTEGEYTKFSALDTSASGDFVKVQVCNVSGKLVGDLCYQDARYTGDLSSIAHTETFIKGTEPKETCDCHKYVEVCNQSGYLATPLCSTYCGTHMQFGVVRPDGESWEKQATKYNLIDQETGENKVSLDLISDAIYDIVDLYCPLHNPDTSSYPTSLYTHIYTPDTDYVYDEWGNPIIPADELNPVEEHE